MNLKNSNHAASQVVSHSTSSINNTATTNLMMARWRVVAALYRNYHYCYASTTTRTRLVFGQGVYSIMRAARVTTRVAWRSCPSRMMMMTMPSRCFSTSSTSTNNDNDTAATTTNTSASSTRSSSTATKRVLAAIREGVTYPISLDTWHTIVADHKRHLQHRPCSNDSSLYAVLNTLLSTRLHDLYPPQPIVLELLRLQESMMSSFKSTTTAAAAGGSDITDTASHDTPDQVLRVLLRIVLEARYQLDHTDLARYAAWLRAHERTSGLAVAIMCPTIDAAHQRDLHQQHMQYLLVQVLRFYPPDERLLSFLSWNLSSLLQPNGSTHPSVRVVRATLSYYGEIYRSSNKKLALKAKRTATSASNSAEHATPKRMLLMYQPDIELFVRVLISISYLPLGYSRVVDLSGMLLHSPEAAQRSFAELRRQLQQQPHHEQQPAAAAPPVAHEARSTTDAYRFVLPFRWLWYFVRSGDMERAQQALELVPVPPGSPAGTAASILLENGCHANHHELSIELYTTMLQPLPPSSQAARVPLQLTASLLKWLYSTSPTTARTQAIIEPVLRNQLVLPFDCLSFLANIAYKHQMPDSALRLFETVMSPR